MTDEEDGELMAALNEVQRHLVDWSFADLAAAYRDVESRFCARFAGRPGPQLDTRRAVADHVLAAAHESRLPAAEYEALLLDAMRLGWASLEWKATALFPFCRYCIDHGAIDIALRYLEPLLLEIEVESRRSGAEWTSYFVEQLTALRARMDNGATTS